MNRLAERPIFIVGNPRSGTTLLRFILCSHPRIQIPDETGFLPFLLQDVETELDLKQTEAVLKRIGRLNRGWDGLTGDVAAFHNSLSKPSLECLLDGLYRKKIAGHKAVRWGDKTPGYALYVPLLSSIFPSAQFVHLIRDGRDVTLSAMKKWGSSRWYIDTYYLLKNWVKHVERGRTDGSRLGEGRYLEVYYESLVRQTEPTIQKICTFIGEELHPDMLAHTKLTRQQAGPRGHGEVREPISTASVQRWKTEMSQFDKKIADHVAGTTLAAFNYELAEPGPLSTNEQLRLRFLSAKFRLIQAIRQGLTSIGVLTLNKGKGRPWAGL